MPIVLTNAILLNLDPVEVSHGAIRVESDTISEVGPSVTPSHGDDTFDCRGAIVMPGLVNGHTHLYSALAPGMPMPRRSPKNFHEILELIWWRLDRALDANSIEMSGRIGAACALRCGTTTLIDHHASPNAIEGSLDLLEGGIADIGLRAVLCYETTDRNGPAGSEVGLEENRRYLDKCRQRANNQFAGLVGAHAAFTLCDDSLSACARLASDYNTGVHIHVAEDPCDDIICREKYGAPLIRRLQSCGLISLDDDSSSGQSERVVSASIFGHGTHLSPEDARRISSQIAAIAHNPRSNMNNRVGYAPVAHMDRVQLGTDGIDGNMFAEAGHAWFKACDSQSQIQQTGASKSLSTISPLGILKMLTHSARVAGNVLGCRLGALSPGGAADLIVTDYIPATPLMEDNVPAHFLFALGAQHVRSVLINGQWRLKERIITGVDEATIRRDAASVARALWTKMQAVPETTG